MGSKPAEVNGFLRAMKIQRIVSFRRKLNLGYHVIHLQHVKEFFTHKRQEKAKFDTIFGHPASGCCCGLITAETSGIQEWEHLEVTQF
jgi:hypothetical protein